MCSLCAGAHRHRHSSHCQSTSVSSSSSSSASSHCRLGLRAHASEEQQLPRAQFALWGSAANLFALGTSTGLVSPSVTWQQPQLTYQKFCATEKLRWRRFTFLSPFMEFHTYAKHTHTHHHHQHQVSKLNSEEHSCPQPHEHGKMC